MISPRRAVRATASATGRPTSGRPSLPLSPYGIAKKCGEEYLAGWNRIHGTRTSSLRFANVYGPRQDAGLEGGVVAIFLERMARGEGTTIFGDGLHSRDFVFVVRHRRGAARHGRARRRRRTTSAPGRTRPCAQLHDACARGRRERRSGALRARPPRRRPALGDRPPRLIGRELGWSAQTSLDDGLAQTWTWMQEHTER